MKPKKTITGLRAALQRFVDGHFHNAGKERPRISIPANTERDDDLVLSAALDELETLRVANAEMRKALEEIAGPEAENLCLAPGICTTETPCVLHVARAALRAAEKAPEAREPDPPAEEGLTAAEWASVAAVLEWQANANGIVSIHAEKTALRLLPRVRAAAEKAGGR